MDKPKRSEYINTVPKRSAKTPFHPVNFAFTTPLSLEESRLRLQDLGASKKFLKVFSVGSDIRVEINEINSDYITFRLYKKRDRSPNLEATGEMKRWGGTSTLIFGNAVTHLTSNQWFIFAILTFYAILFFITAIKSTELWAMAVGLLMTGFFALIAVSVFTSHWELVTIIENALVPLQRKRKEK